MPAPATDHETVANHAGKEVAPMSEGTMDPRAMTERWRGTLGEHLGVEFEETSPERVVARLTIRDELRTVESKTNFFAAGRTGVVRAESTPLHRGKRTMVWQTKVTDESGRMLSLTTQTQMVLA